MKRFLNTLFIVAVIFSCSDDGEKNDPAPINIEPAITAQGTPVGVPIIKEVGSAGGNLSSPDGRFEIEIPAGALTNTVAISLQEITNEAPGGIGLAYRFLPAGTTFSKDVTLKFHYTERDLDGSAVEAMGIAVQADDGSWRTPYDFEFSESERTVFATTTHFTDFAAYEMYKLIVSEGYKDTIKVKAFSALSVRTLRTPAQERGEDELPALPRGNLSNIDDLPPLPAWTLSVLPSVLWLVNGKPSNPLDGTIADGGSISLAPTIANYTAPENIPPLNPVLVTATLSNVIVRGDKLLLAKSIYIKPDEYNFLLEIQGTTSIPCGLVGQNYTDKVRMDVNVKNHVVTVAHIVNYPAAIVPTELNVPATKCTLTCVPGPNGILNVKATSGIVSEGFKGKFGLVVTLENKLAASNDQIMRCPDANPVVANHILYDHNLIVEFVLKDSVQSISQAGAHGYFYKLTPK